MNVLIALSRSSCACTVVDEGGGMVGQNKGVGGDRGCDGGGVVGGEACVGMQ